MTRQLIAANWKMNKLAAGGLDLARAVAARAAAAPPACDIVLCPPATLLPVISPVLAEGPVILGGQDCHAAAEGAYTGDLAAAMLADAGAAYVIIGHSERRAGHGEGNAVVSAKSKAALAAGLIPIICVGETEAERAAGQAEAVVARQVLQSVPDDAWPARFAVAYEPVWAIGSGQTPSTTEIARMHAAIRRALAGADFRAKDVRILYGGSVKAANAAEILAVAGVNGALVGGAGLKADDFWLIVEAAAQEA